MRGKNMGLFNKNPAEKRLKELTGGIFLTKSFKNKLAKAGLTSADGYKIQQDIKESIKRGAINEDSIETRIKNLIKQMSKTNKSKRNASDNDSEIEFKLITYIDGCNIDNILKNRLKNEVRTGKIKDMSALINKINAEKKFQTSKENLKTKFSINTTGKDLNHEKGKRTENKLKDSNSNKSDEFISKDEDNEEIRFLNSDKLNNNTKMDKIKEMKFLLNQSYNLEECPECQTKILKADKFCYKCGCDLLESMINKDYEKLNKKLNSMQKNVPKKSNTQADEMSELERAYNKKILTKYSTTFKFAYVLCLEQINKNPNKEPKKSIFLKYEISFSEIKKRAKEDGYIEDSNPLTAAKCSKVTEIKNVLKEHGLKVSGKKDELIERLGENLSEEELKQIFPKKVLSVTDKGLEFIEKNKHVFYYDKTPDLKNNLDLDSYDAIFDDVEDLNDEKIYRLIIDYLLKREDDLVNNNEWVKYKDNFIALGSVYKDLGDDYKLLDMYFKLFIAGINNFSKNSNQFDPTYCYIDKTYSNELINLLQTLSLDIDELKLKFNESYNDLKCPILKISNEESFVYLLKLFNGEDIRTLTIEIQSKYRDEILR